MASHSEDEYVSDTASDISEAEEVGRLLAAQHSTVHGLLLEELFTAIRESDFRAVRLLLTEFRKIQAPWRVLREPRTGDTPLHTAIKQNVFQMISFMRNYCHPAGNDFDCNICSNMLETENRAGKTVLHEAVLARRTAVVEYLLRQGAIPDCRTREGLTPLMMAANSDGLDGFKMVVVLLERGADPRLTDSFGWTALHFASRLGWVDTVNVLLSRGQDIANFLDCFGRNPLHLASLHGNKYVVELLLDAYSRLDLADNCGLTPLHNAIRGGDIQVIQTLKSFGACLHEHDKDNFTCMHFAACIGRPHVIEFLIIVLRKNVDAQTPDELLTPLHCAVKAGHLKCVEVLLGNGANTELRDAKGRTALEMASVFNLEAIEDLFNDAEL